MAVHPVRFPNRDDDGFVAGRQTIDKDIDVVKHPEGIAGTVLAQQGQSVGETRRRIGAQATVALNDYVSVFAGVNYSVALEALQQIDQENVVWANVGLSFAY